MMAIRATEYQVGSSWDPHHVDRYVRNSIAAENVVNTFLSLFFDPKYFGKIIVWNTPFLTNSKSYKFPNDKNYYVIDSDEEGKKLKRSLFESSFSRGHMSVLFVPKDTVSFLDALMATDFYGPPVDVSIGTGQNDDPIGLSYGQDLTFLSSDLFAKDESVFTFSHDAEYLYVINIKPDADKGK
ncbi:MAG: hypothetical protein ACYS91_18140 [Planctomycetota bacterium]